MIMNETCLLRVVESGTFWTLPDVNLLHVIKEEFAPELDHLKHAYSVRGRNWREKPGSPSKVLYPDGDVYDEINRSLVGVLALRWINNDDYETFTGCQPQPVRLHRESFQQIRNVFENQNILGSKDYKLYVLVTSMVANDLGKSESFVNAYYNATAEVASPKNHDMILHEAARRGLLPAIERLTPEYRNEVKRGIKLGGEFNVGQLAQAENAPSSLAPILNLAQHEDAWNMRWMEQLLDLAGAAGHEDHTCAAKLIEPIFRSYSSVSDVVTGIAQGRLTLRQGYDQNLNTRYHLIIDTGWKPERFLTIDCPEDRALMRLFCMGNVADASSADFFFQTFYSDLFGSNGRQQLIQFLNRDGTVKCPAVQPTYGPGMMHLALSNATRVQEENNEADSNDSRTRTLAAMLRYLARVIAEPPSSRILAQGDVTVIERDCRVTIKDIIESEAFMSNPDILDTAPIPEDAVANRAPSRVRKHD